MKTKLLSLGIMMFCLMGMQSVMLAQTVYVNSSSGNDTSGDGSSGNPYKTFTKGYSMTNAGGTLDLTGTFTWTDAAETGDVADNGSSTQEANGCPINKSITINGHGVGSTIIQAASSSNSSSRLFYIAPTTNITVTFQNLEMRYGKTTYLGGCFFLNPTAASTINILNCHIHDNIATQGGCGIEMAGQTSLNITNSTLSANSGTNASGGGIRVQQATGTLKITNSTICNNTVTKGSGNGLGAGIYFYASTTTSYLTNCTITGNSANEIYGGGICQDNGTVYLKNNLIANNSSGSLTVNDYEFYSGTLTDNGNNIIEYGSKTGSGTGAFSGSNITGNQTNLFGTGISASPSLALNSSLNGTPTLALSAGSVAIGTGSAGSNGSVTVPSTDQRGLVRNTTYDIGAYEYGATVAAPTISSISPTSGLITGGTSVVITGANLTGATAVSFGGTAASGFVVNSATQITATSPAKAAGTVDVTVTTAGGTSATGSSQFTYLTAGTFTGATNSDWNTATNWAGGSVPTSATDVTIPSGKTAVVSPTATATCNNLSVTGNLTIQSSGSGTGSLIVTGTATGSVDCQRYMTNGKWHLISPTASGQTVAAFLTANTNISTSGTSRGMMDYNTLGNNWNSYYQTSGAPGTMTAGKGYATRITTDGAITYTGTLTTGTKTVALTTTGQGWNCVGNPYASAISMNTTANATNNFITVNSSNLDPSYACIYVWDEDATYTGQSCYKVICNSGYSTSKTILAQNYVAPGQGFFVKANSSATNISFTSAMQSSQPGTVFRVPVSTDSWPGITLIATNASTSSSAAIAFNANMTCGLDPTYDAGLLRGTDGLSLYTRLLEDNGVDFAIQCLPEDYNNLTITVGIDSKTGGELTFSAETIGLPQACKLILEDKAKGTFTSLADGKSYTTTVVEGAAGVGRFYLHAGSDVSTEVAEISQESGSLKAYMGNGTIVIEGEVSGRAIATLYNLQGQILRVNTLQKGLLNVLPDDGLPQGAYFITIQQYGQKVTCKLIKK